MGEVPPLSIVDRASVGVARDRVRQVGAEVGLGSVDVERLALAVSELAQNQVDHAREGTVRVRSVERDGVPGVEVEARDRGSGIPDPAGALLGVVAGRGLGAGVAAVRRMVEELDVDVRLGEGTTLTVRRFVRPAPRHPEVAVLGRGLDTPSGDGAAVFRDSTGLVAVVVDGVGHGEPAHQATARALEAARLADPLDVLAAMEEAAARTRGVAATVARWDLAGERILVAGVGNVACRLLSPGHPARHALPTVGVLGVRGRSPPRLHTLPARPRDTLILYTDGISSRAELAPGEGGRSAAQLAQELLTVGAKPHDDALVLVAR